MYYIVAKNINLTASRVFIAKLNLRLYFLLNLGLIGTSRFTLKTKKKH